MFTYAIGHREDGSGVEVRILRFGRPTAYWMYADQLAAINLEQFRNTVRFCGGDWRERLDVYLQARKFLLEFPEKSAWAGPGRCPCGRQPLEPGPSGG